MCKYYAISFCFNLKINCNCSFTPLVKYLYFYCTNLLFLFCWFSNKKPYYKQTFSINYLILYLVPTWSALIVLYKISLKMTTKRLLIILMFVLLKVFKIRSKEIICSINGRKSLNIVDKRFISFSIDPLIFFSGFNAR